MTGSLGAPHSKYSHVFAIIRFDEFTRPDVDMDLRVTVTKVVASAAEAAQEVDRLNDLRKKAGGGSRYFWQQTRLVPSKERRRDEFMPGDVQPRTVEIGDVGADG